MKKEEIVMRWMTKDEVLTLIPGWYKFVDWSYGVYDFACAYDYDPTTYLCAELKGQVVGMVSGLKWDDTYAFSSTYITRPDYRGKGLAILMREQMQALLGDRHIGADVMASMQPMVEAYGFVKLHDSHCYTGIAKHIDHPLHKNVCDLSQVRLSDLAAYDAKHFPVPRPKFVDIWMHQPKSLSRVYIQDGKIRGYAIMREGCPHPQIGPWIAATPEIALALLTSLTNTLVPGATYEACLHGLNTHLQDIGKTLGLELYHESIRVYRGAKYTLPDDCIYACAGPDFG